MENPKKTLQSLDKYMAVGFDVDHCLIRYRLSILFPILYKAIARTLVEEKGYPAEMLHFGKKERCFIMNGLVIDCKTGIIVKLGEEKVILRAYYGYERLSQSEIEEKFGSPAKLSNFDPYNYRNKDYICCITFFECFIPSLLAHMIDFKKKSRKARGGSCHRNFR